MTFFKKNPLFFACLFPGFIDGIFTLLGQDSDYWSSKIVNEASPVYYFLLISPWLFIIGSCFWWIFWYWSFKKTKEPLNLFLMFLFIAGHSWGSASWIPKIIKKGGFDIFRNQMSIMTVWSIIIIYFAVIAALATYFLRIYFQTKLKLQEKLS